MLVIILQVISLFLLYVSGNILSDIAYIDRAVYILRQKNRLGSCKVLHLQTVF